MKTTTKIDKLTRLAEEQGSTKDYLLECIEAYINAIREGRMICSIGSVSKSGMSRTIKFLSCEKDKYQDGFYYRNYFLMFKALGFRGSRIGDGYFTIKGAGMDMIFHTNYTIIHAFKGLGLINDEDCKTLAQQTPTVI